MEMKTSLLQKKNFPLDLNAVETIVYKKLKDNQTQYMKIVEGQKSSLKSHLEKLTNSFKLGIDIVEDKIKAQKRIYP